MVGRAAWYNRVDTVRPLGKGVLLVSALLGAKFLHTANWVRVHKPLNHARVVWTQFGATTSTALLGLFLVIKPCWSDPRFREQQRKAALGDLESLDRKSFHTKWGAHIGEMGIQTEVQKRLAAQIGELSFFEFIAKHGVEGLGDQSVALKEKFNPAEATYAQIDRARVEMEQLGIPVANVLKQRWQAGIPDDERPFFLTQVKATTLAELLADYPQAARMGLPDDLIGRLLAKQVSQDGWTTCMETYGAFYDEKHLVIVEHLFVTMQLEVAVTPEFAKKHGKTKDEFFQELADQAKTLTWQELQSRKPLAVALKRWPDVLASRWFESDMVEEPKQVAAALEADELDREKFQAWIERITEKLDEVLGYEWAAPYLEQSEEMNKRVAQYYWDNQKNSLAEGKFQHLIPDELAGILDKPDDLMEYLTRRNVGVSLVNLG